MPTFFTSIDLTAFWEEDEYSETLRNPPPSPRTILRTEGDLGFRLPEAYVELMKVRNGGVPVNTLHPAPARTTWSDDHIAISSILGFGGAVPRSIDGSLGSRFYQREWGYPDFGICICECPSAGHDLVMLDYRECGRRGEPSVVHVDQERGHAVTLLAPSFESFVLGLRATFPPQAPPPARRARRARGSRGSRAR